MWCLNILVCISNDAPFNASNPVSPIATTCGLAARMLSRLIAEEEMLIVCQGWIPTECNAPLINCSSGLMFIIASLKRDLSWVCMSGNGNIMAQDHNRYLPKGGNGIYV